MKAGWRDAPLAIWDFSRNNKHCIHPSTTKTVHFSRFVFAKKPTAIEERINKKDRPVKVRNFPGATVVDIEHYLILIIQQKPSNIILNVGTNDAKNLPSRAVLDNLLKLKALLKDSLPTYRVFISTLRTDDGKAQITVRQLTKHLLQLKIDTNVFIYLFIYLFIYTLSYIDIYNKKHKT